MAIFLQNREGVTQGGPLDMITYGRGTLPLIENLKKEFPDVTQPWCADNTGVLDTFAITKAYFCLVEQHGSRRGYYSKTSKSVLIVHPDNPKSRKLLGFHNGFKVCTGARYLGGYIRYDESKFYCL